ncbi:MAG: TonB-dependent receptor [Geobacter sp.]|nr:TonB-dependent receptor [Geobacter sp.]
MIRVMWRMHVTALAVLLLGLTGGRAFAQPANNFEVSVTNGYRHDDFDWSIAGGGVNILSELTWRDLEIFQVNASGKYLHQFDSGLSLYTRANFGYGWILSGENQDSDYNGNDRTLEYSRSNNDGGGGNVWDVTGGVGLKTSFGNGVFSVAPLAGFSYREQNLRIRDGYQTIPATGSFSGLDSTYETKWYGPWGGLDLEVLPSRSLRFHGTFEYHWVDYEGVGNWNLRTDFDHPKSFEHLANGYGIITKAGADFAINRNWLITTDFGYQYWTTDDGTDQTFFSNGTTSVTRFNGANLKSYSVMAGVTYRFR